MSPVVVVVNAVDAPLSSAVSSVSSASASWASRLCQRSSGRARVDAREDLALAHVISGLDVDGCHSPEAPKLSSTCLAASRLPLPETVDWTTLRETVAVLCVAAELEEEEPIEEIAKARCGKPEGSQRPVVPGLG